MRERENPSVRFTSAELLSDETLLNIDDLLDAVLTENDLCDRYADASPGDAIVYHVGLLARDRDKVASELPPERRQDLEAIARRVWAMAEAGLGHLLQRRVAEGRCAYLLIVRPRPLSARSAAGYALADLLGREAA
ncbi:hypothetical protein [Falsiroseomonas ponticola]|uniref:hypothetical protein n=1 Tax=Falsiroseomonas ponticola TaxID=2786951 RepID=UPI00193461C1|nr:hypothetical protein [Roseomonas ponticola]